MKVLLVNGSPKANGCTFTALSEMSRIFKSEQIETEIFQLGKKPIAGCVDCGICGTKKQCVFDDVVNVFLDKAKDADAFVFGSPVHYAGASGALTSFLDRVFCADGSAGTKLFYLKPGAAVLSARRAGTVSAFDQINKYFTISQMPVISSSYWNMVHGTTPEEVLNDLEGLQIMRNLARNMSWFLKIKEAGEQAGVQKPLVEERLRTNFIR